MPVTVRTFPSNDEAFRGEVARRVGALPGGPARSVVEALRTCLDDLADAYPMLRVRVADRLALVGRDEIIVYVYRDGTALPVEPEGPGAMRRTSELRVQLLAASALVARNTRARRRALELSVRATEACRRSDAARSRAAASARKGLGLRAQRAD